MLRWRSLCTPILHLALALAAAGLSGCFHGRLAKSVDRAPVVDTGVGATIIMPGQAAPTHLHPYPGSLGPGATTTETGGAPGGAGAQASTAGAAGPPSAGSFTMLGGSSLDEERNIQGREEPVWWKYAVLPFAVVAAPFRYAAEAMRGEPEPGPPVPNTAPERPQVERRPPPVDYETQRLREMEQELDRARTSQPAPAPTPSPVAPSSAESGAPLSIAEELAALQRRPQMPQPSRPTVHRPAESAPGGEPEQLLVREADVADGIVDRDEDGRIDLWIYRENGEIVRKALDQNFDGRPDTTLHYDRATHRLARAEEDTDHDGATDAWTDYRDGQVVRRRADANRDGTVDTWTFYRDGQITRHEQDTTGDGFRDRVGFYVDGKLKREERDSDGDGRPDVTSHYDAQERVARREEDTNQDGEIDLISHYRDGRLARRELLGDAARGRP